MAIAEALGDMVHRETLSKIGRQDTPSRDKMRALYHGPLLSGGDKVKAAFYDALKAQHPHLVERLGRTSFCKWLTWEFILWHIIIFCYLSLQVVNSEYTVAVHIPRRCRILCMPHLLSSFVKKFIYFMLLYILLRFYKTFIFCNI